LKAHQFLKRIARIATWLLAGIFVLAIVGAIYQFIATQSDKRTYPAPGQLVDVGGYRLHVSCIGQGSPTVILEAAADMMSADWGWIQPEIAKNTHVCAYDRAGMGWSEPGLQPRDARQISAELHTLLAKAGIAKPYILVGHSAGGLYVRMYTAQYPDEVVGMVLVDPGHPDMTARIPELQAQNASDARLVGTMRILSYLGIPRLVGVGRANAEGLPPERAAEVNAFVSTPQHWATILALIDATPATYDEVRATQTLGSRPLVVISATTAWLSRGAPTDDARRELNELHAELAGLSTNGRHRIVEGATHGSLLHNRDDAQATIAAIQAVLRAIQTGQALAR
jgi:pimeloyl-ACP methyl ester carboxylesterase